MLLDPADWSLASRIDNVLPALSRRVADAACAETHAAALELASRPHPTAAAAAAELAELRAGLVADLAPLGLRAAVAGMHPFALWSDVEVSQGARHQAIYDSMRELARREPTSACTCMCGPRSRGGGASVAELARPRAAAARPVGRLAVLAGPRHRAGITPRTRLRRVPVRRLPRAFESYAE